MPPSDRCNARRYERLDVLPFIPVYALWLVHCLKTVFTFQWDQMVLLQLGTVALLAVHVRPPQPPALSALCTTSRELS